MKTKTVTFMSIVSILFAMTAIIMVMSKPDVAIKYGNETVASTVCGTMYVASHKATRADFQLLLQESKKVCDDKPGTVTTHRNKDGSLKHSVVIGDEDTITKKGTSFDVCIINWELTPVAAFEAFEDVCLNRRF